MADPLSIASGVAGLISLSGAILSQGYQYVSSVRKAPKELRLLLSETATLDALLGQFEALDDCTENDRGAVAFKTIVDQGAIDESKELLETIEAILLKLSPVPKQHTKNVMKTLLWPLKESETRQLLVRLDQVKGTFAAALTIDATKTLHRIEQQTLAISQNIEEAKTARNLSDIMTWLCPVPISTEENYEAALRTREAGTAKWLLGTVRFKMWRDCKESVMWVSGIPGSGKTILAATIIQHLKVTLDPKTMGLAYFFCDHKNPSKQSADNFITSVILQLSKQNDLCMNDIYSKYESIGKHKDEKIASADLFSLLKAVCRRYERTFIVVDGLDESNEIPSFVTTFKGLVARNDPKDTAQVLITSRDELPIERELVNLQPRCVRLDTELGVNRDIDLYVSKQVEYRLYMGSLKIRNPHLKSEIIQKLTQRADKMFLWAKIQLDQLSSLHSDRAITAALDNLPQGLDETYNRILQKLQEKNGGNIDQTKKLLQWLIGSTLPLTLEALAEAVSLEEFDESLCLDAIATDPRDMIAACGSLVTVEHVERTRYTDDYSKVRLAHLSVQEYLRSSRILGSPVSNFHMRPVDVAAALGVTSIQYLGLSDFQQPCRSSKELRVRIKNYPFLEIATREWPVQLARYTWTDCPATVHIIKKLEWFLDSGLSRQHYHSWQQVLHYKKHGTMRVEESCPPAICYAAAYGLEPLVRQLLQSGAHVDESFDLPPYHLLNKSMRHMNALHVAAQGGHLNVVKLLINKGASLEIQESKRLFTPLFMAAELGRAEVVEYLLNFRASVQHISKAGANALYYAARSGSTKTMDLLYAAGCDIDCHTWDNWTPIFEAIQRDNWGAFARLMKWGADLQVRNKSRLTPLGTAVMYGRLAMVEEIERNLLSLPRTEPLSQFIIEAMKYKPATKSREEIECKPINKPNEASPSFRESCYKCCKCGGLNFAGLSSYSCPHCSHRLCSYCQ